MSINIKKFSPQPGIVNKQGRLPDPSELVCIEVPKVFDQCLIKRCLIYADGPDTETTDCELRSNPLENPKRYLKSRNFNITLNSVEQLPLKNSVNEGYKKLIISYMISFYADYIDGNGVTKTELFEINRTDVIGKFYCPDSIAKISSNISSYNDDINNIIKLEMVAKALDGTINISDDGNMFLDIILGYYIVVKCELITQLLIPAYDYCPVPNEPCDEDPEEDVCEQFNNASLPKFYPDQKLEPLFDDDDSSND